jgi:hypothetical protein
LTFQFADKPAAHLPDPATINGHSMIAQHRSQWALCRRLSNRGILSVLPNDHDVDGPMD